VYRKTFEALLVYIRPTRHGGLTRRLGSGSRAMTERGLTSSKLGKEN